MPRCIRVFADPPMPAEKPTPITPEGRRAADRVRTIFYAIAAANIVIIAIVLWLGRDRKEPARAPAKSEAVGETTERAPR